MLEKAKIVKADLYISKKGFSQVETIELEIEIENQKESKVIVAKGRHLINGTIYTITLKTIPEQANLQPYISALEGKPIRVDLIDGEIVAIHNHLKKQFIFVGKGEVLY